MDCKPSILIDKSIEDDFEEKKKRVTTHLLRLWGEVLNVENIKLEDEFIELGGNSLNAIELECRINQELKVEISIEQLFEEITISELVDHIMKATEIEVGDEIVYSNIETIEERDYYETSSAQKRMFSLNCLDSSSTNYNIPSIKIIEGKLSVEKIQKAYKILVERHESLRTSFHLMGEAVVQKVHKNIDFNILYTEVMEGEEEAIIRQFIRPFNLAEAPLLRVELIKLSDIKHILLLDIHHIISDGVSIGVLWNDLMELYNEKELPQLKLQYKDFSTWQNHLIKSSIMGKQEEYWLKVFSGDIPKLNLTTDFPRPVVQNYDGDFVNFKIGRDLYDKFRNLKIETGSTTYMILLAVLNILFSKYTGQSDIIIASPIAGRRHKDLGNIIGMFVNTLVMRNYPEGNKSFKEFLKEIRVNSLKAYDHQDYQFEELVDKLKIPRELNRNPLFDIMLAMQDMKETDIEIDGLKFINYENGNKVSQFDMTFYAFEENREVHIRIEYCTSLFKQETMEALTGHVSRIIEAVAENCDVRLSDIDILTENEKTQILEEFNNTKVEYTKGKTIHQLFEEQVEKNPDGVAVIFREKWFTYKELNEKANQIARRLIEKGVKPNTIVGIMLERSLEMIIGIMAILKAGGAYLPIDPLYPKDRIKYMLEDSNIEILMTTTHWLYSIDFDKGIIDLEDEKLYVGDKANLAKYSNSQNLAYVIYTSGSTGNPKGAMIQHYSLVNRLNWMQKKYPLTPEDVILQKTPFTFDVSVWEIFWWGITGAQVCMLEPGAEKNPKEMIDEIKRSRVTTMHFVPSMLNAFLEYLQEGVEEQRLTSLKQVFTSGEALTIQQARKFNTFVRENYNTRLTNLYGPTEATIDVTYFNYENEVCFNSIPIGKPIDNTQIYILSNEGNLQPIGVPGELYIAGDGVASGYLNRPELTAEKFVNNPFAEGQKMYKTGDLAKWLNDGNIEFLGRIDHQVKIRGFRIELGEIESKFKEVEEITDVAVLDKIDTKGNKALWAYIVSDKELTVEYLRDQLSKQLPEYMIPSYFVQLEKLPLSVNGKLDRSKLLNIENTIDVGTKFDLPTNKIEKKLVEMWRELLSIEKIGTSDNFFNLGGHSLRAIVLISKIRQDLNVEISLSELFKTPTIKGIAKLIYESEEEVYFPIEVIQEQEYYEASSAQRRMFTLNQFDKNSINYNMPMVRIIEGYLDVEKLKRVFKALVERHEILRTSFELVEERVVQKVNKEVDLNINCKEVIEGEEEPIIDEFIRPFDLSKAPLLRVELIKLTEIKHILLFDMHHIISDGVSMEILWNEFFRLYANNQLPPLRIQYKDFSAWQNQLYMAGKMQKQENYWLNLFNGEIPQLNMPTDYPRPLTQSFSGDRISFTLEKESFIKIKKLMMKTNTTLYMILLATYTILLSKYTGQTDIVVGSPVAGRQRADLSGIIGIFVNTLAMRNYPEGNKTFKDFILELKENALKAYENQDYQFEELVDKLKITRELNRNPLFDVMFTLENKNNSYINTSNLTFGEYNVRNNISKFDITLFAFEGNEEIDFTIEYSSKLFKKGTIERLVKYFKNIVEEIVRDNNIKLSEIDMLTETERQELLVKFNDTKVDYPKNKTIPELFQQQVDKTPNNIAISFNKVDVTYKELNEKSNQLAHTLSKKGVKADTVVALMTESSIEMIVGIMGILKAGGAYLPIDPEYPEERIKYMLEDSCTTILLTQSWLMDRINFEGHQVLLDDIEVYDNNKSNLDNIVKETDLAYIIYTSGSTGKPKGNLTMHYNVVRLLKNCNYIEITQQDNILQLSNYAFDGSVFDIFSALLNGAKLTLINKEIAAEVDLLAKVIKDKKITVFFVTTALFNVLVDMKIDCLKSIRKILFGGERVSIYHARKALECLGANKIIHVYGPTESTVYATYYNVNTIDEKLGTVPIGSPLSNTKVYIVDHYYKPQPIGVVGELCIGGDGVARGYLNRQELTLEKFVDNPFELGEKMYKTGDLAKWLPDGNIEFVGRIDNQVKLRGFRIELGEVENKLLNNEFITEVIVLSKENKDGGSSLWAYLVAQKELTVSELRAYLSDELPDYMIPSYFIQLKKLPLTPNGKVDQKALLAMENILSTGVLYEAPTDIIQQQLVVMWKELLDLHDVSINDNFFNIGGHSLKAVVLMSRINKIFNVEITLSHIFKYPTIKGISTVIKELEEVRYLSIETIEEQEYYEASSAQKRMFTLNQFDKNSINYNMPLIQTIEGELDVEKLSRAFQLLVNRHESLRTSFELMGEKVVQRVYKEVDFIISYTKGIEGDIGGIIDKFIKPFDLSKAPLLRVELVKLTEIKYILLFDMHHIISDGVSMGILWNELFQLYSNNKLPSLRIQYKDFSTWQNQLYKTEKIQKQENYWLSIFNGEIPQLNMPTDYSRPLTQSFEGDSIGFKLDKETHKKLRKLLTETGTTLYMLLLSAYNILLSKYTGQTDIVVGSPVAGRHHADLDNVVGMFVNTLALRNFPEGNKDFKTFLMETKENLINAYENQDYQLEELVEKLKIPRELNRNPLFDVMFALQKIEKKETDIIGLKLTDNDINTKISKFDMTLSVIEMEKEIVFDLQYSTQLFNRETMERLGTHFIKIVEEVAENQHIKLADIDMLTVKEKQQVLYEFNNTKANYPKDKTIHQLFEQQVERTPLNTAVVFKEQFLTYKELNEKANSLARVLRDRGVKPDTIVGIMVEPSLNMIIGIMAILKAGGAYLPIDPTYPQERIAYMLVDSKAQVLLAHSWLLGELEGIVTTIPLDNEECYIGNGDNLNNINTTKDLAYIIYTSGSTGEPKGVMIEHKSVINLCYWLNEKYNITKNKNIIQSTNVTFDVSVEQIQGALLNGGTIYIPSKEVILDKGKFKEFIKKNEIQFAQFVPATLKELLGEGEKLKSLKVVTCGGDQLSNELKDHIISKGYTLYNHYGPTETTVDTLTTPCIIEKQISLGKPINNVKTYILSKDNTLQPIGVVGELYITGDGLARGYLNRPELTAEKFIDNPFVPGEKMFKTGDLAKWLSDGNIEFLGRIDHQVKIRGFRIELGEIESKLLQNEFITDAILLVKEDADGNKELAAYIVAEKEMTVLEIRQHLSSQLPDYMIPSYFIQLEKLPLTSNGKIDRKALTKITGEVKSGISFEEPTNSTEERLLEIWKQLLSLDKISIIDNFFEIGGHSLKAITLSAKISQIWSIQLDLTTIFKYPTIKGLAVSILDSINNVALINDENVVLLKSGVNSKHNLFFIHDGTGEVGGYIELSNYLKYSYNVYGIQMGELCKYAPVNISIKELAIRYIEKIKLVQKQGPYFIIGWSTGGTIAYEITKQLEAIGEKVQQLILIDTFLLKNATEKGGKFTVETEKEFVKSFIKDNYFNKRIKEIDSAEKVWSTVRDYFKELSLKTTEVKSYMKSDMLNIIPEYAYSNVEILIKTINTIRTLDGARNRYEPTKIYTDTSFFKPREEKKSQPENWKNYIVNPLKVVEIPGNHISALKEPHVKTLAETIIKVIDANK